MGMHQHLSSMGSDAAAWDVSEARAQRSQQYSAHAHPEPSPDLCHGQLPLAGRSHVLLHADRRHQTQSTSVISQGTSMGLGWWGDPRLAGGPPEKEMPCPSVQCSITTCPRSPAHWQQVSQDARAGIPPHLPQEAPWHPHPSSSNSLHGGASAGAAPGPPDVLQQSPKDTGLPLGLLAFAGVSLDGAGAGAL